MNGKIDGAFPAEERVKTFKNTTVTLISSLEARSSWRSAVSLAVTQKKKRLQTGVFLCVPPALLFSQRLAGSWVASSVPRHLFCFLFPVFLE